MKYETFLYEARFHIAMAKSLSGGSAVDLELRARCIENAKSCIEKHEQFKEMYETKIIDLDILIAA